jgi:TatD DNase family protein
VLTDSHAHLVSHRYPNEEIAGLVDRSVAAGVTRIVSLTTALDDLDANLTIAQEHTEVQICIGIHPCEVHEAPDDAVAQLASHGSDDRVCGVGETGLDYFHPAPDGWEEGAFRERQRTFLHQHFEMAIAHGLNVAIHTRDKEGEQSFEDALAIYKQYAPRIRAVFHCFIGRWDQAKRVIDLGGLVSFGGVLTFKSAQQVRDTAVRCPSGSYMLETDAPYLAPEPYRGQRNEPAYVKEIAERLAVVREETVCQIAEASEAAASAFFRFRKVG